MGASSGPETCAYQTGACVAEALGVAQYWPRSCAPSRSAGKGRERTIGRKVLGDGQATGWNPTERRQASLVARPDPGAVVMRELAVAWEDSYPRAREVGRPLWRDAEGSKPPTRNAIGRGLGEALPFIVGEAQRTRAVKGKAQGDRFWISPLPLAAKSLSSPSPYRAFPTPEKQTDQFFSSPRQVVARGHLHCFDISNNVEI